MEREVVRRGRRGHGEVARERTRADVAMWICDRWEKYNARGWSEKGAHKYGRLKDQSWWEKWGEQYDGRGAVVKWTDKWAESDAGTKWGDKWEERFNAGTGTRQGETWHVSPDGQSERLFENI